MHPEDEEGAPEEIGGVYDDNARENLMGDDEISPQEEAFMAGYESEDEKKEEPEDTYEKAFDEAKQGEPKKSSGKLKKVAKKPAKKAAKKPSKAVKKPAAKKAKHAKAKKASPKKTAKKAAKKIAKKPAKKVTKKPVKKAAKKPAKKAKKKK